MILSFFFGALLVMCLGVMNQQDTPTLSPQSKEVMIPLPAPKTDGHYSVERALLTRRSVRSFKDEAMSLSVVSQLVWAAQGITQKTDAPSGWSWGTWQGGRRTAPSAGALYPLELYAVAGNISALAPGIYKYKPQSHQLERVKTGDHRAKLAQAALGQEWIRTAPCVFVVSAIYSRTEVKYDSRAERYAHIEVGHAVENICLQAVAMELGSTVVGAFKDGDVKELIGMPDGEEPLIIVPIGMPASKE